MYDLYHLRGAIIGTDLMYKMSILGEQVPKKHLRPLADQHWLILLSVDNDNDNVMQACCVVHVFLSR